MEKQSGRRVYWSRVLNYLMRMEDEKQWEANIQLNVKLPEKGVEKSCCHKLVQSGHCPTPGSAQGFCCQLLFRFFFFLSLLSIVQITMSRYFT